MNYVVLKGRNDQVAISSCSEIQIKSIYI